MASGTEVAHQLDVELNGMVKQMNQEARSRARRAVNVLRNAAQDVLAGQRSGRRYKLPHKKGSYQASAPGEPPAVRSGNLRRNWRQEVIGSTTGDGVRITCRITSAMPYARILEHGAPARNMAPRPYTERIKAKAVPEVRRIYSSLV